jgi:exonuclease VII small subunit
MNNRSMTYEENFSILEKITESLNKDEVGIDDLVEKTREALSAARVCMEILNKQKGEFKKLEVEFSQLLQNSAAGGETVGGDETNLEDTIDQDDPF